MKYTLLLFLVPAVMFLPGFQCEKKESFAGCYKGRLEIKGMCLNYTIKLLEGSLDTSLVEAAWKDPQTGASYTNVFRLGSPCTFPPGLKAGDEFYFRVDRGPGGLDCVVCMAYYPTPAKSLKITVLNESCQ